jgi:PAS domain S-box-containing protein
MRGVYVALSLFVVVFFISLFLFNVTTVLAYTSFLGSLGLFTAVFPSKNTLTQVTQLSPSSETFKPDPQQLCILFSQMLNAFAYGKILTDTKGKATDIVLIDVNEAFENIAGLKKAAILGKNLTQILPEIQNNLAEWLSFYEKISTTGKSVQFESYIEPFKRWFNISAYSPQSYHFVCIFEDITERKKTQDALRLSEERLCLAQKAGQIGVFEWNLQTNLVVWTPELEALFGLPKGTFEGKHEDWAKRVHPEDIKKLEPFLKNWITSNRDSESWEYRFIRADTGELRWMACSGHVIRDANGKPIRVIGTDIDITERKKLQAELEAYAKNIDETVKARNTRLNEAQRLAAIGATAGMVGHDIRNPLQTVIGQLYLAKCELKSLPHSEAKANLKEICEIVEDQTIYVNKIVSDLQDYAKPLKPIFGKVAVHTVVRTAISAAHVPKIVKIFRNLPDESTCIKTDKLYLQRIIANLITNAIQAMPMGGKITIAVNIAGGSAFITVEDTGVGIAEDAKNKLFQPLFTTKSKGQGFGLAVVKRLTEALGGTVTFESEEGKGTKFIVTIPQ